MSEIGNKHAGENSQDCGSYAWFGKYTSGGEGLAQTMTILIDPNGASNNIKVGLWLDSDLSLLAQGILESPPDVKDWYTITLDSNPEITAVDYWLGARAEASCDLYYDSDAGFPSAYKVIAYASFPANPLSKTALTGAKFSMYVTYTEEAEGDAIFFSHNF